MSLTDTIFILIGALVLFGPKKLPELARQLGKIMGELRRASNEFKFQMEEELRQSEAVERQNAAAAPSAAAPLATPSVATPSLAGAAPLILPPSTGEPIANVSSVRAQEAQVADASPEIVVASAQDEPGPKPSAGLEPKPSAGLETAPSAGLETEPSAGLETEPSAGLETEAVRHA